MVSVIKAEYYGKRRKTGDPIAERCFVYSGPDLAERAAGRYLYERPGTPSEGRQQIRTARRMKESFCRRLAAAAEWPEWRGVLITSVRWTETGKIEKYGRLVAV